MILNFQNQFKSVTIMLTRYLKQRFSTIEEFELAEMETRGHIKFCISKKRADSLMIKNCEVFEENELLKKIKNFSLSL